MTQPAKKTFNSSAEEKISAEFLRNKLKLKSQKVRSDFYEKYPHVVKFFSDKGLDISKLREHSAKVITTGALTGTLLLSPPTLATNIPNPTEIIKDINEFGSLVAESPTQQILVQALHQNLPQKVGAMTRSQEKALERVFEEIIGIATRANLEGEHLNTTYGYIGAEQHLMRYPGDTMATHPSVPHKDEGMAPGRGAWGYFAQSRNDLTADLVEKEKWYAVVQTLYLPDWSSRQPYIGKWYKYRKVLIVNTVNGNAVVADIADAGPAAWTGKHFGGSPEVMNYLGGSRYKKGPVVVFFVDDPNNKVPLGPVEYNKVNLPGVTLTEA